jgi:hypothetical protein
MDVAYVIRAKTECPERSDWAATLLTDVRKHIVDKGVKCKLSTILSTDNSDRYQLHLEALRSRKGKHCTAVFEDELQSLQDMGVIFTGSLKAMMISGI